MRYSVRHRLQKSSACFDRFLVSVVRLPFVSGSGPDVIAVSLSSLRKCAGVNGHASSSACTILELIAAFVATRVDVL